MKFSVRPKVFFTLSVLLLFSFQSTLAQHVDPPCTALSLRLPSYVLASSSRLAFSVDAAGARQLLGEEGIRRLVYQWSISEGNIVSGQGTRKVVVDLSTTSKRTVHSVTITVKVTGLPPECGQQVTSSLKIDPDCVAPAKYDEYGDLSVKDEYSHLERVAKALRHGDVGSIIYVVSYAGRDACAWEADWRAERAKNYLVQHCRVPVDHIIVVDGGFRENLDIELFLLRRNDCGPLPTPTLAIDDARVQGLCSDKYRSVGMN
jgi:hypothetical protein